MCVYVCVLPAVLVPNSGVVLCLVSTFKTYLEKVVSYARKGYGTGGYPGDATAFSVPYGIKVTPDALGDLSTLGFSPFFLLSVIRQHSSAFALSAQDFSPTSIVGGELLPSRHVLGLLGIFSAFAATGCVRSITVHATMLLGFSAAGRPSSTCSAAWHSAKRNKT